jgi:hypothetical protein
MSEPAGLEAVVGRIVDGRADLKLRTAAARGALPLPRATLVRLYVHLLRDDEEDVRHCAKTSLASLDPDTVLEVLGDEACAPEVLQHYAPQATRDEALAEKLAFHAAVPRPALALLAGTGNGTIVDLVLTNEERLLKVPGLLDTLMGNPALRADQRGRILELLERVSRRKEQAPDETAAEDGEAAEDEQPIEEVAELLDVDVGELLSRSEIIDGEEFEQAEDPVIRDAYRRIVTLNTAQKAVLAMKGGREERMILIRDSNKVVSLGVLKNPRMTENEAETIAKMRNVNDEVLRQVGINREWSKSYSIVHALVTNPRTPPAVSTNFITRLNNRDLKDLSRSKDIPELIRRMAKRTMDTRNQAKQTNYRKK